jgi:hypothetical protein
MTNFYTGDIQGFGLFNLHGVLRKNFFAFKGFHQLLGCPRRVSVSTPGPDGIACAAGLSEDGETATVFISHVNGNRSRLSIHPLHLPWDGGTHYQVLRVDAGCNLNITEAGQLALNQAVEVKHCWAPAVVLIRFRKETGRSG